MRSDLVIAIFQYTNIVGHFSISLFDWLLRSGIVIYYVVNEEVRIWLEIGSSLREKSRV